MYQSLQERCQLVIEMCNPDFDFEGHEWPSLKEEFGDCIQNIEEGFDGADYLECGSASIEDTPLFLYRLLWLCCPLAVNFGDMYKGRLFGFLSVDKQFLVSVETYKYELGLYFYAKRDLVIAEPMAIIVGWPGGNNGSKLKEGVDGTFFEMVKKVIATKHRVYGGNNFEV